MADNLFDLTQQPAGVITSDVNYPLYSSSPSNNQYEYNSNTNSISKLSSAFSEIITYSSNYNTAKANTNYTIEITVSLFNEEKRGSLSLSMAGTIFANIEKGILNTTPQNFRFQYTPDSDGFLLQIIGNSFVGLIENVKIMKTDDIEPPRTPDDSLFTQCVCSMEQMDALIQGYNAGYDGVTGNGFREDFLLKYGRNPAEHEYPINCTQAQLFMGAWDSNDDINSRKQAHADYLCVYANKLDNNKKNYIGLTNKDYIERGLFGLDKGWYSTQNDGEIEPGEYCYYKDEDCLNLAGEITVPYEGGKQCCNALGQPVFDFYISGEDPSVEETYGFEAELTQGNLKRELLAFIKANTGAFSLKRQNGLGGGNTGLSWYPFQFESHLYGRYNFLADLQHTEDRPYLYSQDPWHSQNAENPGLEDEPLVYHKYQFTNACPYPATVPSTHEDWDEETLPDGDAGQGSYDYNYIGRGTFTCESIQNETECNLCNPCVWDEQGSGAGCEGGNILPYGNPHVVCSDDLGSFGTITKRYVDYDYCVSQCGGECIELDTWGFKDSNGEEQYDFAFDDYDYYTDDVEYPKLYSITNNAPIVPLGSPSGDDAIIWDDFEEGPWHEWSGPGQCFKTIAEDARERDDGYGGDRPQGGIGSIDGIGPVVCEEYDMDEWYIERRNEGYFQFFCENPLNTTEYGMETFEQNVEFNFYCNFPNTSAEENKEFYDVLEAMELSETTNANYRQYMTIDFSSVVNFGTAELHTNLGPPIDLKQLSPEEKEDLAINGIDFGRDAENNFAYPELEEYEGTDYNVYAKLIVTPKDVTTFLSQDFQYTCRHSFFDNESDLQQEEYRQWRGFTNDFPAGAGFEGYHYTADIWIDAGMWWQQSIKDVYYDGILVPPGNGFPWPDGLFDELTTLDGTEGAEFFAFYNGDDSTYVADQAYASGGGNSYAGALYKTKVAQRFLTPDYHHSELIINILGEFYYDGGFGVPGVDPGVEYEPSLKDSYDPYSGIDSRPEIVDEYICKTLEILFGDVFYDLSDPAIDDMDLSFDSREDGYCSSLATDGIGFEYAPRIRVKCADDSYVNLSEGTGWKFYNGVEACKYQSSTIKTYPNTKAYFSASPDKRPKLGLFYYNEDNISTDRLLKPISDTSFNFEPYDIFNFVNNSNAFRVQSEESDRVNVAETVVICAAPAIELGYCQWDVWDTSNDFRNCTDSWEECNDTYYHRPYVQFKENYDGFDCTDKAIGEACGPERILLDLLSCPNDGSDPDDTQAPPDDNTVAEGIDGWNYVTRTVQPVCTEYPVNLPVMHFGPNKVQSHYLSEDPSEWSMTFSGHPDSEDISRGQNEQVFDIQHHWDEGLYSGRFSKFWAKTPFSIQQQILPDMSGENDTFEGVDILEPFTNTTLNDTFCDCFSTSNELRALGMAQTNPTAYGEEDAYYVENPFNLPLCDDGGNYDRKCRVGTRISLLTDEPDGDYFWPEGGWDYIRYARGYRDHFSNLNNDSEQLEPLSWGSDPQWRFTKTWIQSDDYDPLAESTLDVPWHRYTFWQPYTQQLPFADEEYSDNPVSFARWVRDDNCYSAGKCLEMKVDQDYWDYKKDLFDEFYDEMNTGQMDFISYEPYTQYNQYQKLLDATEASEILRPGDLLKVSFWMKTLPEGAGGTRPEGQKVEVSIARDDQPPNRPDKAGNSQGDYNSLGLHYTIGSSATFQNTKFNEWEQFEYVFRMKPDTFDQGTGVDGLYFLIQWAGLEVNENDYSYEYKGGHVFLDDFSVTETGEFTPDVDVRSKKAPSVYGVGSLTEYYDPLINSQEYIDTTAPLEAQFYFYPRYFYEMQFDKEDYIINYQGHSMQVLYDDFENGHFFLYDVDFGDGSPKEFTDKPLKLGNNVSVNHTYSRSGIFEITGYMLRIKPAKFPDGTIDHQTSLGVMHNKKFTVRININEGIDEDFQYFGSADGFSFIPLKNSSPVIGGYSPESLYSKTLARQLGFIDIGEERQELEKVGTTFFKESDKLKTEHALMKLDSNYEFGLEELPKFLPPRYLDPIVQDEYYEYGYVSNDSSKINNGVRILTAELGNSFGEVDLTNVRYFDKPKEMYQMLGFTCDSEGLIDTLPLDNQDWGINFRESSRNTPNDVEMRTPYGGLGFTNRIRNDAFTDSDTIKFGYRFKIESGETRGVWEYYDMDGVTSHTNPNLLMDEEYTLSTHLYIPYGVCASGKPCSDPGQPSNAFTVKCNECDGIPLYNNGDDLVIMQIQTCFQDDENQMNEPLDWLINLRDTNLLDWHPEHQIGTQNTFKYKEYDCYNHCHPRGARNPRFKYGWENGELWPTRSATYCGELSYTECNFQPEGDGCYWNGDETTGACSRPRLPDGRSCWHARTFDECTGTCEWYDQGSENAYVQELQRILNADIEYDKWHRIHTTFTPEDKNKNGNLYTFKIITPFGDSTITFDWGEDIVINGGFDGNADNWQLSGGASFNNDGLWINYDNPSEISQEVELSNPYNTVMKLTYDIERVSGVIGGDEDVMEYLETLPFPEWLEEFDINQDGVVNVSDQPGWISSYNRSDIGLYVADVELGYEPEPIKLYSGTKATNEAEMSEEDTEYLESLEFPQYFEEFDINPLENPDGTINPLDAVAWVNKGRFDIAQIVQDIVTDVIPEPQPAPHPRFIRSIYRFFNPSFFAECLPDTIQYCSRASVDNCGPQDWTNVQLQDGCNTYDVGDYPEPNYRTKCIRVKQDTTTNYVAIKQNNEHFYESPREACQQFEVTKNEFEFFNNEPPVGGANLYLGGGDDSYVLEDHQLPGDISTGTYEYEFLSDNSTGAGGERTDEALESVQRKLIIKTNSGYSGTVKIDNIRLQKQVEVNTVGFFDGVYVWGAMLNVGELLPYTTLDIDPGDCDTFYGGNPASERYWKNIIPQDLSIFEREGIDLENQPIVDLTSEQGWIGSHNFDGNDLPYYYPVLPKYDKYGKFGSAGGQFYPGGDYDYPYNNIPFPTDSIATTEDYVDMNLQTSINVESSETNVMDDLSGNQNNGFIFTDYKPSFDDNTQEPNQIKNVRKIRTTKTDGAF